MLPSPEALSAELGLGRFTYAMYWYALNGKWHSSTGTLQSSTSLTEMWQTGSTDKANQTELGTGHTSTGGYTWLPTPAIMATECWAPKHSFHQLLEAVAAMYTRGRMRPYLFPLTTSTTDMSSSNDQWRECFKTCINIMAIQDSGSSGIWRRIEVPPAKSLSLPTCCLTCNLKLFN